MTDSSPTSSEAALKISPRDITRVQDSGNALLAALVVTTGKAFNSGAFRRLELPDGASLTLGAVLVSGDLADEFVTFCRSKGLEIPEELPLLDPSV
jgi:hypothetical protein